MTPPRHYIGIMTGTSLDGIDAALIRETGGHYHYLAHHEHPMPVALRATLQALCQAGDNELHRAAVAAWLAALPPVDVLINNAGFGLFKEATACNDAENSAMLRLNVLAAMQISAALLPPMQARGSGQLIFIASQAGKIATPKAAVYAASKHALLGYANALRLELRGSGITVTTVNPGPMATPFFDTADPDGSYQEKLGSFWLLDPERIAALTVAAIDKNVREINRPRLMEIAARLYPLAPLLGDWLTVKFFNRK